MTYPRIIEVVMTRTQQFAEWYKWAGENVGSVLEGLCMVADGLASAKTMLQYRIGQRNAEEKLCGNCRKPIIDHHQAHQFEEAQAPRSAKLNYPSGYTSADSRKSAQFIVRKGLLRPTDNIIYGQHSIGRFGGCMSTILYARVSTLDQNAAHQRTQAEAVGFTIDEVVCDEGVSGVSTRLQDRPQGKRLYDMLRRDDTLVVRWVDRLGRNYQDVTDTIRHFMRQGVVIRTVINNMRFDGATADPVQQAVRDALIAFMAATAEAQAEATKAAQRAGIDARRGDETRYRGKKPSYDRATFEKVVDLLGNGAGASAIAKATGVSRQSVLRIRDDRANAEKALAKWDAA